jgi:signal transduction histidine kinase
MLALGRRGADGVRAFLYVDRTEATVDEQRAIMLERLASLGRAMQEVAHELNTPLASIQTLAVDLSHAVQSQDAAESVALIVDEARRCQQISRELLSTARIGSSSPVRTVLGDVVRRAARLTYGRRGGVVLKGDPDIACMTDSDRLLQILVNLLQNASDASDKPVEVTITRGPAGAADAGPPYAEIAVRDFGPGLPPAVRERLFLPFVSTKPPGQGTGLGLYTCSRLAQQLRAELHVDNAAASSRDGGPDGGQDRGAPGVLARLRLPLSPEGSASP